MQDANTLIEQIQERQAQINKDLELLKQKEDDKYAADIQAMQNQQSGIVADLAALQSKIKQDKNGGAK